MKHFKTLLFTLILALNFGTYTIAGCINGNLYIGGGFCCTKSGAESYSCTNGTCWFCWGTCVNGENTMQDCMGGPLAM